MSKGFDRLQIRWQQFSSNTRLWWLAGLSGVIYLAFTLPYPLRRFYDRVPPVDYAKLTDHSAFGFIAYLLGITALFGLYLLLLQILATQEINPGLALRWVVLGGAAFAFILIFSYPQTAIDLFVYAIRTRGWALYGFSPFITPPEALPASDAWLGLAGEWADAASPYGPVWEWLSLGVFRITGGGFLAHLIGLKIIGLLAYLGCIGLVYTTMRMYRPQWAVIAAAFFAWNPLVLFEGLQNAHNDLLMVLFLLAAVWAFAHLMICPQEGMRLIWLILFMAGFSASILVKFVSVAVLPFFLLALALQAKTLLKRILTLSLIGLAIAGICVLAMQPYWPGLDNWALLRASHAAGRSLTALLILILRDWIGTSAAFDVVNGVIYVVLGGVYLGCLWQVYRRAADPHRRGDSPLKSAFKAPVWAAFVFFFIYVLIGVSTFHAWYLLWFVPLGALLVPEIRPVSGTAAFSLMALMVIPYYETVRVWLPYLNANHTVGHLIGVSLLVIPVVISLRRPLRILETPINSNKL